MYRHVHVIQASVLGYTCGIVTSEAITYYFEQKTKNAITAMKRHDSNDLDTHCHECQDCAHSAMANR